MGSRNFFLIKTDGAIKRVSFDSILFIESFSNYTKVHTVNGEFLTSPSLKDLELFLPAELFMRIHKSYIIALDRIKKLDNHIIYLDKDYFFPIGATYRDTVHSFVSKYSLGA